MDALIDKIYEAATVADGWPRLFEQLGAHFKTRGGLIFTSSLSGTTWTGGGEALEIMQDFVGGGWMLQNDRVPRMVTNRHPGFITDLDLYSWDQVHTLPMYTEFLIPRGVFASAATVVSGLGGDDLILSLEGFESHDAVAVAIPTLDQLRPHLARAGVMAARLGLEQANAAVRALEMIGTPAAVVGSMGQVRAVNDLFSKELGVEVLDFRDRLQLADRSGSAQLADALGRIRAGQAAGRSIAIRGTVERGPRILHVLPIRGAGYDIFPNSSAILILALYNISVVDICINIARER